MKRFDKLDVLWYTKLVGFIFWIVMWYGVIVSDTIIAVGGMIGSFVLAILTAKLTTLRELQKIDSLNVPQGIDNFLVAHYLKPLLLCGTPEEVALFMNGLKYDEEFKKYIFKLPLEITHSWNDYTAIPDTPENAEVKRKLFDNFIAETKAYIRKPGGVSNMETYNDKWLLGLLKTVGLVCVLAAFVMLLVLYALYWAKMASIDVISSEALKFMYVSALTCTVVGFVSLIFGVGLLLFCALYNKRLRERKAKLMEKAMASKPTKPPEQ
jgi:hypothetical protein